MPKFFYGIIAAILLLLLIYTFTKPILNDDSSTEHSLSTETNTENATQKKDLPVLVLDAGHGGFDPGKVGVNNILEKDINLSIVKKLQKLLEEEGFTSTIHGKGTYVKVQNVQLIYEEQKKELESELERIFIKAKQSGITKEEVKELTKILLEETYD